MAKIILEFDANEEGEEAQNAIDGTKWSIAMFQMNEFLRTNIRRNESLSGAERAVYEKVQEEFLSVLSEYNLKIH
jgi:hypothetical protein